MANDIYTEEIITTIRKRFLNNDENRARFVTYLREGILSEVRRRYGESVESSLYYIVHQELNSGIDNYLQETRAKK